MPSDGTIGGLVGKLDVLRLECPRGEGSGRGRICAVHFASCAEANACASWISASSCFLSVLPAICPLE
jgi:hypothetical protein